MRKKFLIPPIILTLFSLLYAGPPDKQLRGGPVHHIVQTCLIYFKEGNGICIEEKE